MKHIFLINSFTVKNNVKVLVNKIDEACTEQLLEKYKDSENIIMAVGGDGVINRVLNSIMNTKNVLGFIPYGTGNDFYKSIIEQCPKKYNRIDVGKINDKYFINVACFGIDSEVANNTKVVNSRLIPKSQRYNVGVFNSYIKYRCKQFIVDVNNEHFDDTFTTIAVCNGMYYGDGFKIAPNSKLDSGVFDIYVVPKMDKASMLGLILGMKKGKHENSSKVKKIQAEELIIKSNKVTDCNIDGERLEADTFNIKIIKSGIGVYYNKELTDEILN